MFRNKQENLESLPFKGLDTKIIWNSIYNKDVLNS